MEAWPQMAENPVWAICERAAEVQTLLDDHMWLRRRKRRRRSLGAAGLTGLDLRNHGSQNTFEALISASVRDKPISRNSSSLRRISSWHKYT